ncbi:GMC family oxidoreductase [Nonomuraea sediminis]|uniref:GMC family oxidoreductase n=1 Tax=Nonomuraea sediminis TaxID=2835864 RepID=UPI001BDC3DF9|nr:GMC family oxidoreductase N-terminal domain-containing protein [Nonomuraea sediminis]
MESYDIVVVGAGSAGAAAAGRLAERADLRVLLLEAGGPDTNPDIHDPGGVFRLWGGAEDYDYLTAPQSHLGGRRLRWPRGRVLGGSSSLNGMIFVRGAPADFDGWGPGWSYAECLPYFRRLENFSRGASAYHGTGGPVRVVADYEPHPVNAAIVEAAVECGVPYNEDCNGERQDGAGFCQLTVHRGRRHSTAAAYLGPGTPVEIRAGARARRLLLRGSRCVGVEFVWDGALYQVGAGQVVVSAGTLESPRLLMLSGLGPAQRLRGHGIGVAEDLPEVGRNLHDHALVPVIVAARRPVPPAVPGLPQMHSQLFWRSRAGLPAPDVQPLFFHVPLYDETMSGPQDAFTLMAGIVRPESRGALELTSADPDAPLRIDPAYLREPVDVACMRAAVELCRQIARAGALRDWADKELYPAAEDLPAYVERTLVTYHHQAGTCAMGTVVDHRLRVLGIDGLRVADASVMPAVTSGNTNAPTIMIGERCADLVLEDL